MKAFLRLTPFLLNLGLGLVVALLWHRAPAVAPSSALPSPAREQIAAPDRAVRTMNSVPAVAGADRRRSLIDRLRALGAPNEFLARVAQVDIDCAWEPRFEACHGATDKLQAMQLAMEQSHDAEMKAALGEEGFRQWDQGRMLWEAMSTKVDVTDAEASAIYGFKKSLQARQLELEQARLQGKMDDAQVNAAYDQAYAQFYTQLKGVLGDERYDRSQQLDDSFVADNLRSQLASVHPTDEQVQQLLTIDKGARQARLELDHQFQDDLTSREYQERLSAMTEAENKEYERVLGADAYQAYQKSQDPTYGQLKKYETHWGLDDGKVDMVYNAMADYGRQVDEIKGQVHALQAGSQPVDWPATQQKLQQLADGVQQRLLDAVGQASFDALQRNRVLRFVRVEAGRGPGQ